LREGCCWQREKEKGGGWREQEREGKRYRDGLLFDGRMSMKEKRTLGGKKKKN
jgi:hypothetical protein